MAYSARLGQANDRIGLIIMVSIFTLLIVLFVIARFYSRTLSRAGFGADDWLAFVGLIFVLALNGIFLGGTIQGAITGHSPVIDNWPATTELEHLAQKYKYAFQTTEKITFGLIKLSLLFLWKRIFGHGRYVKILCWVMIGVLSAWSLAFFFATVFQCGTRWTWNWAPIGIFLTQCTDTLAMLTVFTATDLLTDFIIIFMPVPLIWKLHMPTSKKIGVTGIFMVGLFTIGAGIARMYIYLVTSYDKETNPDFIADFTLFILWSEIEANVAMMVCCLPVLGPVLSRLRGQLRRFVPSKWLRISDNRTDSHVLIENVELSIGSGTKIHPLRTSSEAAWGQTGHAAVIAAGYADVEGQYEHSRGILARTEISRTFEPKP